MKLGELYRDQKCVLNIYNGSCRVADSCAAAMQRALRKSSLCRDPSYHLRQKQRPQSSVRNTYLLRVFAVLTVRLSPDTPRLLQLHPR